MWSSVIAPPVPGGNAPLRADRRRRAAQLAATAAGRTSASRTIRRSVAADEVEQDQRAQLAGVALARRPSSRAARSRSNGARVVGRLLAVEQDEAQRGRPRRPVRLRERARQLEHGRRARRRRRWRRRSPAGPSCRSARRSRPPASRPAGAPTTLRSPGWPGHGLEAPARERVAQPPGEPAQRLASRRAAGPSSTWRSSSAQRPRAVEAVRRGAGARGGAVALRGRGARAPPSPSRRRARSPRHDRRATTQRGRDAPR